MKLMAAGKRDRRIEFRQPSASRNALGGKAPLDWIGIGSRFARVLYGTGAERRAAAGEQAVKTATFRTLADSLTRTITTRDRIVYGGLTYDITDITPIGIGPSEFEFTGTASRD